ncbi:hypothetical protein HPB47_009363 [Ixodes persulcatus]|uniref:Uncharacterized protein n=1 Tax=Ixodes persulcatus TaxID=34615 RepID=A0AC60P228_IXOPE|nr:hypothetical protein HPB47_009363 [Ixodes persulcatus]
MPQQYVPRSAEPFGEAAETIAANVTNPPGAHKNRTPPSLEWEPGPSGEEDGAESEEEPEREGAAARGAEGTDQHGGASAKPPDRRLHCPASSRSWPGVSPGCQLRAARNARSTLLVAVAASVGWEGGGEGARVPLQNTRLEP